MATQPFRHKMPSEPLPQAGPSGLNSPSTGDDSEATDDSDGADIVNLPDLSDEDAESLMGLAISRAATRLTSPRTPAAEKAAAITEDFEGAAFSDSDAEMYPEPVSVEIQKAKKDSLFGVSGEVSANKIGSTNFGRNESLSHANAASPTSYPAEHKHNFMSPVLGTSYQSALQGVFESIRKRSRSGGADALKKFLPKSLSSIPSLHSVAHASNFFGGSSSSNNSKPFAGESLAEQTPSALSDSSTPNNFTSRSHNAGPPLRPQHPGLLRHATSDESLLYHSISKASSLGDDTRFENQREQVNSRIKAIRDSLQDRSSFRMPQLPQIPSMPYLSRPFNFPRSFFNSADGHVRSKSDTNVVPDILGGPARKTGLPDIQGHLLAPGVIGAAAAAPEAAIESSKPVSEGSNHHFLDEAMETLTGDVVILGGYRGSVLRSAKPPHRQLWVPVKVGLNIRKVDLEVGLEPEDEERMEEKIFPSGMLQNIGPVDISKRLFKRLSECENAKNGKLRIWDYGYDWRLSPHLLSRKFTRFLEKLPSNLDPSGPKGALVIAHSLGGLITRHVVNSRPELFSGVIYAGVPNGCVNILGPFRNGDAVLLSSRVLTAQVNFTLRTSFLLLPEDGRCFIDINTKEAYPVDFFNLDDWIKYRWSPCTDSPLPPKSIPSLRILNRPVSLGLPSPVKRLSLAAQSSTSVASKETEKSHHVQSHSESNASPVIEKAEDALRSVEPARDKTLAPQMGNQNKNTISKAQGTNTSIATAVTIPRDKAIEYLRRTLAEVKKFKEELHFKPELSESNRYPPLAVIYNKSIPTVYGAKVDGRDGIACADAYDNLAFASGDGVVLARESMLPEGYKTVYRGRIRSDRGHVTLLGDLNAVGRAISAVAKGRAKGIGSGVGHTVHKRMGSEEVLAGSALASVSASALA